MTNNKILIELEIPLIEKKYDLFIPINKKIGTIKNTLISFIQNEYGFSIKDTGSVSIIEKETGNVLNEDIFVYDSIIRNGTKILLI